jgi:hypothetical protein
VNLELIDKVLTQLNIKNMEVGISLNIPYFFTNVLKVPNVEGNIKTALSMKIQTEFPLPQEKYIWSFQEIPSFDSQRTFLVFFYHRDILEPLNKAFAVNGILPVVIEPSILSALRYLKEKFTLEVDKTYFMIILYASVLTGFIYENGIIKNAFSELITLNTNLSQSLEKFIQFTLQRFSIERIRREIGGLILVSEENIDIGAGFEVLYLQDILKIPPDSIITIGLNERVLRAPVSDDEILLNIFNPATEFLYLKLLRYLNFWSVLVFGLGLLTIFSLYGYGWDLSVTNKDLKVEVSSVRTDISKHTDKIKEILFAIAKVDVSKNIPDKIVSQISAFNQMMQIKNAEITDGTLKISGRVKLKELDRLKKFIATIEDGQASINELQSVGEEIKLEISLTLK